MAKMRIWAVGVSSEENLSVYLVLSMVRLIVNAI